ncbi:MAG: hypothetical protein NW216_03890 [Hyphomicrobium sp.]|nr:hypothetical protein [Hyphomicrobium sp.]
MSESLFHGRRVLWMPLEVAWAPPSKAATFCCESMQAALDFTCPEHTNPFDCADALVVYNEVFDEFGLVVHDGGPSYILIAHCPWCGTRLPPTWRDRWFDETEALLARSGKIPDCYFSGAWRRSALPRVSD